MQRIAISLAGHTNNGKTTLARTLLRENVGVVDDRPHVTDIADGHVLAKDGEAEIILWDLPGFGDSARLKKRLMQSGIVAWLQSTFDRWTDRPLWCSQQCLQNARNDADVVLYLVEAKADPAGSAEVRAEMEVLGMIGKPVILLLNQTGMPDGARDGVLVQGWLDALRDFPFLRGALPLDGWMRCWIQESVLFEQIAGLLDPEKLPHFDRLIADWKREHHDRVLADSIQIMAKALAETAADRAVVEKESLIVKVKSAVSSTPSGESERAQAALVAALVSRSRSVMEQLLQAHKLEGVPKDRVDSMVEGLRASNPNAPPEALAVLGGIGSGLLAGLLADVQAGGMTFGGGAAAGALVGGLAAYALGRGYQKIKGRDGVTRLQWSKEFLIDEWIATGMRYLTIAHFGRGKGQWEEPLDASLPQRWKELIDQWTKQYSTQITTALSKANSDEIKTLLENMIREILDQLYTRASSQDATPRARPL
jgi:hypothetical protein